jgi:hypothetical protein
MYIYIYIMYNAQPHCSIKYNQYYIIQILILKRTL